MNKSIEAEPRDRGSWAWGMSGSIGVAAALGYSWALVKLNPLAMGDDDFIFFPIPGLGIMGEALFVGLICLVASWHLGLSFPTADDRRSRWHRWGQRSFALGLLVVPIVFRITALGLAARLNP